MKTATPLGIGEPAGRQGKARALTSLGPRLSREAIAALEQFSLAHRLRPETLALGAWAILLSRYSREDTVVFGAVTRAAVAPTVLEVQVLPDAAPPAWLENLEARLGDSRLEAAAADLEASGTLVVWGPPSAEAGAGTAEDPGLPAGLALLVTAGPELTLNARYDPTRFPEPTIRRLLGHVETLLRGLTDGRHATLAAVPMLTEEERRQVLVEWNDTAIEYPADRCLHQLVEAQAQRTPDAVAVVFQDQLLTYRDLDTRASQLACRLAAHGVKADVPVGISMERSLDMVIGLLGILKAGGAYVPLDPAYPRERVTFMLEDSGAPVVLTQRRLLATLPAHGAVVVCVDDAQDEDPAGATPATVHPEHLAYVIYTSGSTGRPKGVGIEHRNAVAFVQWARTVFSAAELAGTLASTSTCFDLSVFELFVPLSVGGRVILAANALQLPALPAAGEVTLVNTVPSAMTQLIRAGGLPASVRTVNLAGEPLPTRLVDQIHALGTVERVVDLYGPSETTTYSTYAVRQPGAPPTIGRPIGNTRVYLLDQRREPVPIGVVGELYIGGTGVARGYLHRPELTAERFVPDPFRPLPGARLYRTGDLARYREDGNLEFLGRLDHQVKVRGFRIELGEVENALARHPGVRESVVIVREDAPGDKRLAAYVTLARNGADPTAAELRTHLRERLPEYMVPSAFVVLDAIPLTPNGKVDRTALPAPDPGRQARAEGYAEPRSELERYLAGLWCEVLGLDAIGIHDRFFEAGGDSLLGATLVSRLHHKLGEPVYVVALFEAPTVAQLAAYLERHYAGAVARTFGAPGDGAAPATRALTHADVTWLRQRLPDLLAHRGGAEADGPRGAPALFILAPHRSGTTLLRVMLAGHPGLFAGPELQLLGFTRMDARREALQGSQSVWLEGTIRSVMEIKGCDAEEAKRLVEAHERRGASTREFYHLLQAWVSPRIVVDKSPSYALDPAALRRAEQYFQDPLYIHLVRHPYAMARSFADFHIDRVLFRQALPYSARQAGELVWTLSHQNILDFLDDVPPTRWARIRFEDLTAEPETVVRRLCGTLGLDFHPALLRPYDDTAHKMTDGIHRESTPMGDTKFFGYGRIAAEVGERWREMPADAVLGDVTWQLAERLGYERLPDPGEPRRPAANAAASDGRSALERQRALRQGLRAAQRGR